jgi:hypothetical protein
MYNYVVYCRYFMTFFRVLRNVCLRLMCATETKAAVGKKQHNRWGNSNKYSQPNFLLKRLVRTVKIHHANRKIFMLIVATLPSNFIIYL